MPPVRAHDDEYNDDDMPPLVHPAPQLSGLLSFVDQDDDDDMPPLVDNPIPFNAPPPGYFQPYPPRTYEIASFPIAIKSSPPPSPSISFAEQSKSTAFAATTKTRSKKPARDPSYIPRPPNAFILFRSSFIRSQRLPGNVEGNHSTLSKIIGMYWKKLPPSERAEWEAKAEQAQIEHRKKYPDWRFRPGTVAALRNRAARSGIENGGTRRGGKKKRKGIGDPGETDNDEQDATEAADGNKQWWLTKTDKKGVAQAKERRKIAKARSAVVGREKKIADLLVEGMTGPEIEIAVKEWEVKGKERETTSLAFDGVPGSAEASSEHTSPVGHQSPVFPFASPASSFVHTPSLEYTSYSSSDSVHSPSLLPSPGGDHHPPPSSPCSSTSASSYMSGSAPVTFSLLPSASQVVPGRLEGSSDDAFTASPPVVQLLHRSSSSTTTALPHAPKRSSSAPATSPRPAGQALPTVPNPLVTAMGSVSSPEFSPTHDMATPFSPGARSESTFRYSHSRHSSEYQTAPSSPSQILEFPSSPAVDSPFSSPIRSGSNAAQSPPISPLSPISNPTHPSTPRTFSPFSHMQEQFASPHSPQVQQRGGFFSNQSPPSATAEHPYRQFSNSSSFGGYPARMAGGSGAVPGRRGTVSAYPVAQRDNASGGMGYGASSIGYGGESGGVGDGMRKGGTGAGGSALPMTSFSQFSGGPRIQATRSEGSSYPVPISDLATASPDTGLLPVHEGWDSMGRAFHARGAGLASGSSSKHQDASGDPGAGVPFPNWNYAGHSGEDPVQNPFDHQRMQTFSDPPPSSSFSELSGWAGGERG